MNSYTKKMQLHRARNHPHRKKRNQRSLATDIPKHVRQEVLVREKGMCVMCGSVHWLECHHYVEKSRGGMGIKENLVMLCKTHHDQIHKGNVIVKNQVTNYLAKLYPSFSDKDRIYDKWR